MHRQRGLGLLLCGVLPVVMAVFELARELDARGVLNHKDLPPIVGHEPCTLREWLLNVWHWDMAVGALLLASLPCCALGLWQLFRARGQSADDVTA